MRYRKTVVLFVSLLLVFSFSTFAKTDKTDKTKKLRRLGTYPLVKGGVASPEALKTAVDKHSADIEKGFEKAGAAFLYPAFMEQVKTAELEAVIVPKGKKLKWMLFKAGRKAKAVQNIQWEGRKTLDAFSLTVQKDCKDYEIIIPKKCGNISLAGESFSLAICDLKVDPKKANIGDPITVDMSGSKCATKYEIKVFHPAGKLIQSKELTAGNAQWKTTFKEPGDYFIKGEAFNADGVASENKCEAKVYINYPPVCDLKVTPTRSYVGKPFKLDASGSTDKDGKVVKADFTIYDSKTGNKVDEKSVTSDPLVWEKTFKKSGIYNISLQVTDDFKAVSGNECKLSVEVQKRSYLLLEGGPMVSKGTYSGFIFARVGYAYLINPEKLSFIVSAGPAVSLGGAPFKTHIISNLLLNVHFGKGYFGAGLGFTSKVRDGWKGGLDIVGNFGIEVLEDFNKKGSIFVELRMPVRDSLKFKDAHQILLGFRLLL